MTTGVIFGGELSIKDLKRTPRKVLFVSIVILSN